MSEAKHTPGPWCISEAESSFEIIQDCWSDDGDHLGAVVVRAPEIDPENGGIRNKADARRIVACVNACEGFSIEELEDANLFQDSIESGNLMYELLEALKQCRLALEPYDDVKPRDWKTDREKLAFAHQAACAAIATATAHKEGGAA